MPLALDDPSPVERPNAALRPARAHPGDAVLEDVQPDPALLFVLFDDLRDDLPLGDALAPHMPLRALALPNYLDPSNDVAFDEVMPNQHPCIGVCRLEETLSFWLAVVSPHPEPSCAPSPPLFSPANRLRRLNAQLPAAPPDTGPRFSAPLAKTRAHARP